MTIIKNKLFRIKPWITWIEDLILVCIIFFTFYLMIPIHTTKTLFVPKGSIVSIISQLNKKGYELSTIDKYILQYLGVPKTGWISIGKKELNRIDFLYKLTNSKAMIHKITLIPGETLALFFQDISSKLDLNQTKLHMHYSEFSDYKEAGIFSDTYHVPHGIKEKNLIQFLIRVSNTRYKKLAKKAYGDYNKAEWRKVLIIASIIQKEAANRKEMPLVSSVIYNRLKKKMRLQMDGTLNYGKYSHTKVTTQRIRNDLSSFNTYKHRGLPQSPIGSVSSASINAAIHPAKTNYLYFMKNKSGVHDFTNTFKKHRKNILKSR